jgi:hypothetical protein
MRRLLIGASIGCKGIKVVHMGRLGLVHIKQRRIIASAVFDVSYKVKSTTEYDQMWTGICQNFSEGPQGVVRVLKHFLGEVMAKSVCQSDGIPYVS